MTDSGNGANLKTWVSVSSKIVMAIVVALLAYASWDLQEAQRDIRANDRAIVAIQNSMHTSREAVAENHSAAEERRLMRDRITVVERKLTELHEWVRENLGLRETLRAPLDD